MKVSILTPDFAKGGVDRAYLLAQVLRSLQHEVEVLGVLMGDKIYPEPPADLPIVCIPRGDSVRSAMKQVRQKINGDVIYAVKPKVTSFGIAMLKKLRYRTPVILDMDDWEMSWLGGDQWKRPGLREVARGLKRNGALRSPNHPIYLKTMEKLVSQADALTIDTTFLKSRFGGTYLPNGKDTELFNPNHYDPEKSRRKYGLENYRVLMFPGAPRPHKGLEDVLIALDKLDQDDLRLVIVGGSPYDNYEQQLAAKWSRWVINLPPAPLTQMPEIVSAAHVVVVPQRDTLTAQAQFPIKLTEGMAMAKPVLATRVGDIPNVLGGTGFLVDPASPDNIAQEIQAIFQHWNVATARGMRSRSRCIEHYSVKAMAPIVQQVLDSLPQRA